MFLHWDLYFLNMKVCKICNIEKDLSEFNFRKDRGTYDTYCKICRSDYYKDRKYDRKKYFSEYDRKITSERKSYLKEYLKPRRYKYREKDKQNRVIYDVLRRVLRYTSSKKVACKNSVLGWSKEEFTKKIGTVKKGFHVDHKIPISWFLESTPIHIINDLENLHLLVGEDNTRKRNRYCHPVSSEYLQKGIPYIKPKYQAKLKESVELLIDCV